MSELAIEQYKISKCYFCNKFMYWKLRGHNVNKELTDKDISRIAQNCLGDSMQEWCENCDNFTLQTVVAFDLKRETLPPNQTKDERGQ